MAVHPMLERELIASHNALESSLIAFTDEALEDETETDKAKRMLHLLSGLIQYSKEFEARLTKAAEDVYAEVERLGLADAKSEDDPNVGIEEDLFCIEEFLRERAIVED